MKNLYIVLIAISSLISSSCSNTEQNKEDTFEQIASSEAFENYIIQVKLSADMIRDKKVDLAGQREVTNRYSGTYEHCSPEFIDKYKDVRGAVEHLLITCKLKELHKIIVSQFPDFSDYSKEEIAKVTSIYYSNNISISHININEK